MKIVQMVVLGFLISFRLTAQTEYKKLEEAENLFAEKKYGDALSYYLNLLKADSSNANLNFKTGVCYLHSRSQKEKSIDYLQKAILFNSPNPIDSRQSNISIIVYKFLGEAYQSIYRFTEAIDAYEKFKSNLSDSTKDQMVIKEVNQKIDVCKTGKELKSLIISPSMFFEEVSISEKDSLAEKKMHTISVTMYDRNRNEATVATSVDGQIMLIYKNDKGNASIYTTYLNGNQWIRAEKLDKTENKKGWEPNEWISADGSSFYFTSDRPGGYGGKDIYRSIKSPNGEWSKAVNLGPSVNTIYDEEAPFIYPDGTTLFFSSNRNVDTNGYDIFSSTLLIDGNWSTPINVGYPIKMNDNGIYTAAADKKIYASSVESTTFNKKNNYLVTFLNFKNVPLTLMKGEIVVTAGKIPLNTKITVTDNVNGEIVATYYPDHKTGQYSFILPVGRNNNITCEAEGFLFHSENVDLSKETTYYEIYKSISLSRIMEGSKIILNNVFFESNNSKLLSVSNPELKNTIRLLNNHSELKIEIAGYITNKGNRKINAKLAEERAQAIIHYFIENGIKKERIAAKGFGKQKSKEKIAKDQLTEWVELKITEAQ